MTVHKGVRLERRTTGEAMHMYCDGSLIGDAEAWSSVMEGGEVESGCVEDSEGDEYWQRVHTSTHAERWGINMLAYDQRPWGAT